MSSSKKSDESIDEKIEKVIIKRQITLLQGVAIIVGIIIGSGIFVSPVGILKETKSVGFSLVMWVVCGIYNTLCAICYAELGTTIPESGGEYVYIKRAFGDIPAFICLWINFLLICPVGIAASALIFSLYILKPMFPDCEIPEEALALLAACIFCLLIAVNCRNVKWAAKVQVVITLSKLIALAIIIVIGMYYIIGKGETENFENAFEGSDYSAGAIAISFYSGFWAYSGWSYLNFLVGELVDPNRNLPRAILISMTLVIVTYLIANVAYLGVLSPVEMLKSPAVAVTFGERTMGVMAWLMPVLIAVSVSGTMNGTALSMSSFGEYSMGIMAWLMPVLIAISVCGTMNGCALSMSRLFFVGAQNKQFPTFMSMIDVKRMTPSPSLLVILLLTMLYVSSKDIFFLIEMEGFGFASVLTMVFAGQIYMRYREPDIPRPIRVHIILPIILFLISFGIVVLTFYQKPKESFMALGLVAAGIFLYIIGTWKHKPKEIADKLHSLNIFIQKMLLVMPPDNSDEIDWE